MHIWICSYFSLAKPLVDLMHKNVKFQWQEQHDQAMQALKNAITTSPALIPINYSTSHPVFLTINSSWRAVGWILLQECEDSACHPSCFGSIAWNEHEQCYSQPKIELYGVRFPSVLGLETAICGHATSHAI